MLGPISYRISGDDYISFCKLIQGVQVRNFTVFIAALVALIAVFAIVQDRVEFAIGGAIGGLISVLVVPFVMRTVIVPQRAQKAYLEYRLMHEEMTLEVTDDGFSITQASGHVVLRWSDIVYWNENERVVSVHPTQHLGYIFPKEQIGSDHAEFIRRRLAMHGLPEKGVMRPK